MQERAEEPGVGRGRLLERLPPYGRFHGLERREELLEQAQLPFAVGKEPAIGQVPPLHVWGSRSEASDNDLGKSTTGSGRSGSTSGRLLVEEGATGGVPPDEDEIDDEGNNAKNPGTKEGVLGVGDGALAELAGLLDSIDAVVVLKLVEERLKLKVHHQGGDDKEQEENSHENKESFRSS